MEQEPEELEKWKMNISTEYDILKHRYYWPVLNAKKKKRTAISCSQKKLILNEKFMM